MIGRPTKTQKQRSKHIKLTTKASYILQKIKQQRPSFDFSRYVSEHLIKDFAHNHTEQLIKLEVGQLNKEIQEKQRKINHLAQKLQELRKKQIELIKQ